MILWDHERSFREASMRVYCDRDADVNLIKDKKVAIQRGPEGM
jgi:hypothetical protein